MAEWILNGEPPYDLIEVDADRYSNWADAAYTVAKVRECYGMNNAISYPREERPAGRPTARRRSAVYDRLRDRGAEFGFHSGWEQPNWFALPGDQPGYIPSFRRTNWSVRLQPFHFLYYCHVFSGVNASSRLGDEAPKGGEVWGGGVPLPTRRGVGRGGNFGEF